MENENVTVLHPEEDLNSATVCAEGEEISVCNCENDEEVTLFESEDEIDLDYDVDCEEELTESPKDIFARKCREIKEVCNSTAARLVNDWKETNGNPYIKQTCVTQIDVYKNPEDETPIDTFRTEQVKSYSARSMAVLGAAAFVVACTAETIVKKLLKNH